MPPLSQRFLLACTLPLLGILPLFHVTTTRAAEAQPTTPIHHLVIIYDENVSFDHYFATYPHAANPNGEPAFIPARNTPTVNTLEAAHLLAENPNADPANGADAALPFRLDISQASTADQNHAYTPEQLAYHHGKADLFPRYTGRGTPGGVGAFSTRGQVMGYFDGNTVAALWRYAQRFAMSDAAYTDTYGPSTPGALEVSSGQTNGMRIKTTTQPPASAKIHSPYADDGAGGWTMINDIDPADDVCSTPKNQVWMSNRNVGDLLNAQNVSWGGFMGGFDLTRQNSNGTTGCGRSTYSTIVTQTVPDYIPHHNWFQYHTTTANPSHARPSSIAAIGHSTMTDGKTRDPANHQYDLEDFFAASCAGTMPAVSFIKLPAYQDGHAGYSNPLDEQQGIVRVVNFVQSRPEWKDTAIIIAYDDSDGWYDHAFTPVAHASYGPEIDQLDGPGRCGKGSRPFGVAGRPVNGRCGPGTRIPFLVLSPWVRPNSINHTLITQSSITRFIEDNWLHGTRLGGGAFDADAPPMNGLFDFSHMPRLDPLYLEPKSGIVISKPTDQN